MSTFSHKSPGVSSEHIGPWFADHSGNTARSNAGPDPHTFLHDDLNPILQSFRGAATAKRKGIVAQEYKYKTFAFSVDVFDFSVSQVSTISNLVFCLWSFSSHTKNHT
jgi:hypothetical protein